VRTEALRGGMRAAALELLDGGGAAAVTTRAVAARTGSSLAAVHELFGGKPGLVRAIYADGFRRLAAELSGLDSSGDPEQDVLDLTLAIWSFARRHRHQYEVMFSRPFAQFSPDAEDLRAAEALYRIVLARVVAALGAGRPRGYGKDAAIGLLAVTQGLIGLDAAGLLASTPAAAQRRWRAAVTATLRGAVAAASAGRSPA
jgi:AcrR family transcriptional regulator